jgi:hypothetical protein
VEARAVFPPQFEDLCRTAADGVPQSATVGPRTAMHTATLDDTIKEVSFEASRAAHRALVEGRHAAEDLRDKAVLRVRQHPLEAVAWMLAAGALAGCMIGYALRRPRARGNEAKA